MAKIVKVTGYLVYPEMDDDNFFRQSEVGGYLNINRLQDAFGSYCDAIAKNFTIEDRDIGEWSDDNVLNDVNCPVSECEKYFADNDLILLGKNADKLSPENKNKLFEMARQMFDEDFEK